MAFGVAARSKLLNDVYRDSPRFHQLSLSLARSPCLSLAVPVPVHQLMAVLGASESFLKVFANFRYPFSCIFKQAICFYCPSLITLRAKYTCVHVFVRLLLVCIRACGPLKRLYWVIYCAAIAIMFCVSEQTLIYTWLYHMFSNISPCFSFVSLIRSLCAVASVQHFQFWFHWLSLSAVDRVSRVESLRWYFSFDDFTRCGIGCCCCCGYLLLLNLCVSFIYLLIWLCWVCFLLFFRFINILQ